MEMEEDAEEERRREAAEGEEAAGEGRGGADMTRKRGESGNASCC